MVTFDRFKNYEEIFEYFAVAVLMAVQYVH